MKTSPILLAIGPLPPPISGMTKAFELVVRGLPERGWQVEVVDTADPTSADRPNGSFSMLRVRSVAAMLWAAARKLPKANVVYVAIAQSRLGFAKDAILLRIAALFGRPVVVHMHGGNFGNFYRTLTVLEQHVVRSTLDGLARIIVLTDSLKADFDMTADWQTRTVAISNACECEPGSLRVPPVAGALRVLYLSNLVVPKGYRDVIQAVAQLARRRPALRLRLDLAGALAQERDFTDEKTQRADLNNLLRALPPQVTAEYHGVVKGEHKARLLREADVFSLPTYYMNEGQPIAVLEALAAGLPVIATDWRGIRESLPPAMYDLLVPPRSPGDIADRLQAVLDDPAAYVTRSRAALDQAALFRPEHHLTAIDEVLRATLTGTWIRPDGPAPLR